MKLSLRQPDTGVPEQRTWQRSGGGPQGMACALARGALFLLVLMILLGGSGAPWAGMTDPDHKHNLSAASSGSVKATTEQEICVFCHFPHNANPAEPLWNHTLSGATYTPYSSGTLFAAAPGQPSGRSKLCLSCHDGTIAVGSVRHMPRGGGAGTIAGLENPLTGQFALGTDLSDDHPVSIGYDVGNSELAPVATLEANGLMLDENGQIQCGSCHDPHDNTNPKFLRKPFSEGGQGAVLCRTCHDKQYWSTIANQPHRDSLNQWNGAGNNPWHVPGHDKANDPASTPLANSCENCHRPHSGGNAHLVKGFGEGYGVSEICLACHNLNVASKKDIAASLDKMYGHPVKSTAAGAFHMPERMGDGKVREQAANLGNNRHAQCTDCHNPHAVSAGVSPDIDDVGGTNNLASNVLKGVWGVEPVWPGNWGQVISFTEVDDIQYQYQLCLKCHSYYAFGTNPPTDPWGLMRGDGRLTDQSIEFNPNNESYHPVVAPGKNDFIMSTTNGTFDYSGSLLGNLTPGSTLTCADCHSDDAYTGAAGTVPKGPHGSNVWPILRAPWNFDTSGSGSSQEDLCFKCHSPTTYGPDSVNDGTARTGFSIDGTYNLHWVHSVVTFNSKPCVACHAAVPHGWKRRALLVFGRTAPDPSPYFGFGENRGLDSRIAIGGPEKSGNWKCCNCHYYFINFMGYTTPNC